MKIRFLPVCVMALITSTAAAQKTWYVDAAASGPGSGTLADPFATIQTALDASGVLDGDTISVAPGTYVELVSFGTKLVTVESQAGPLATTILPPVSGAPAVVSMSTQAAAIGAVLEGFTVAGVPGLDSRGVRGFGGLVRRCIVRDHQLTGSAEGSGVFSDYDLFVEHCTIVGCETGADVAPFFGITYLESSIVYGNGTDLSQLFSFQGTAAHSLWGTGVGFAINNNLPNTDPELWKPDGLDLHLKPGSPAIDAGNPNLALDPDGSRADMGALPFDATYAPAPAIYCTSKLSSDGCLAAIGASGTAGLSLATPFTVTATGTSEFKNGIFFFGLGASPFPFEGGWFCVTPPTARTPLQSSGSAGGPCSGVLTLDFNAWVQSAQPPFLTPGSLIYGQYWLRDPGDPFGSVRTDAVEFGLAP